MKLDLTSAKGAELTEIYKRPAPSPRSGKAPAHPTSKEDAEVTTWENSMMLVNGGSHPTDSPRDQREDAKHPAKQSKDPAPSPQSSLYASVGKPQFTNPLHASSSPSNRRASPGRRFSTLPHNAVNSPPAHLLLASSGRRAAPARRQSFTQMVAEVTSPTSNFYTCTFTLPTLSRMYRPSSPPSTSPKARPRSLSAPQTKRPKSQTEPQWPFTTLVIT